ncbi:hypothetical protein NDU88_006225 [Pleurodeles waltl]|uniref:Uncharacterized protein n=1 Tax=Pleurodeles waltl TaxID=8319 RepID=A0AAV7TYW5_PLEWA|nr:hypothetical protein NDU88_006225 [Pleurodeles waltl]
MVQVKLRQRQMKEDFYTTKKKHITPRAKEQNDSYNTINSDEEAIEDTGGIPGKQNLAIQTEEEQELHQQLALIDVTAKRKEPVDGNPRGNSRNSDFG